MQQVGAKIHYPQLQRCKTLSNACLQNANDDSSGADDVPISAKSNCEEDGNKIKNL
jgi:2-C-methyl-D-erythritol 4-phosphate cytidylyltransferase